MSEVTFSQADTRLFILGSNVYTTTDLTFADLNHNDAGIRTSWFHSLAVFSQLGWILDVSITGEESAVRQH